MKITPEHFAVLEKAMTECLNETPWLVTEYQAAGFSPQLLRWDTMFTRSGIRVGDSVGMTCPENIDPALFLPLYDYADDSHIDTALREVFKKAGFAFGAAKTAADAPPLVITNGNQFTPSGNMVAEIVHRDQETGAETKATCLVLPTGQVLANAVATLAQTGSLNVIDITGDEHSITVGASGTMTIDDMDLFVVRHCCYTITTYDLVITDDEIAEGHGPEREDGSWEAAAFSFDEIEGEASNLSMSEYDAVSLYSTDPSGTREYYENGVNRSHHLQIDAINGHPPTPELVACLGNALGLTPNPDLAPKAKPAKAMGM